VTALQGVVPNCVRASQDVPPRSPIIIREPARTAQVVRKAHSPLCRIALSPLATYPFDGRLPLVDGRFLWVARMRTNTCREQPRGVERDVDDVFVRHTNESHVGGRPRRER
jgi:hypothetical protein